MGTILSLGIALLLLGIFVAAVAILLVVVPDQLDNLGYVIAVLGVVLIIVAVVFPNRVP
jgi:hypothetical protein